MRFQRQNCSRPTSPARTAATALQPPAREMVRRLAAVNPQAQVEVLKGLGHMGLVGNPAGVLPTLQKHWARALA